MLFLVALRGEFINIMRSVGEETLSNVDLIAYFLNSGGVGRRINRGSKSLPNEYYSNPVFRSIVDSMDLQIKHGVQMDGAEIVWDPWKVFNKVTAVLGWSNVCKFDLVPYEMLMRTSRDAKYDFITSF